MTGLEHYRQAQSLLEIADGLGFAKFEPNHMQAAMIALAQVHATLALVAAVGANGEWRAATGTGETAAG